MKAGIDYIGLSVFALIFNPKGQVLLVDHFPSEKKTEGLANCWSMPGGTIEFGESAAEALKREIKEELGINIFDEKLLGYNEYIKKERHWIGINFIARTNEIPKNLEPEKIQNIRFFDLRNIPKNCSKFASECLGLIKK